MHNGWGSGWAISGFADTKPVNPNVPDTGDNANPMLWAALMAAAVYVLWLSAKKRTHA